MEKIINKNRNFKNGEKIILFLKKDKDFFSSNFSPKDDFFIDGTVVVDDNYCRDGMVVIRLSKAIISSPFLNGRGISSGDCRPEVMKVEEFKHLLEHPHNAYKWAYGIKNFDIERFIRALKREAREKNIKI